MYNRGVLFYGICFTSFVLTLPEKKIMPLYETTRIERMMSAMINLCVRKNPSKDFVERCYDRFEEALEEYIDARVQEKILQHERGLFIADEDSTDS